MPEVLATVPVRTTVHRSNYPGKHQPGTKVMLDRLQGNSRRAVRRFGSTGERLTKLAAPVDTGYMKSKVGHEVDLAKLMAEVFVDGWLDAQVGAYYAIYVEYGTRHMAAQPFFWPSIRTAQRQFLDDMRRVFR